MFKRQTQFNLPSLTLRFCSRFLIGGFCFTLLSGFSSFNQDVVFAQTPATTSSEVRPTFQLPFTGYLSQKYYYYHQGLDLATGLGMPIKPITTGKVTFSGYDIFGYGLKVEIDHGNGYKSLYAHMGKTYVKEGQEITDINSHIGEVGLTGKTSGPHTHLEVMKDGKLVDAQTLLPEIRAYPVEEDFKPVGGKNLVSSKPKIL